MLELQILSANVVLPVAVMLLAWGLVRVFYSKRAVHAQTDPSVAKLPADQPTSAGATAAIVLVAVAAGISIIAAMLVRVEACRSWFPEDAWARIPHTVGLVTISAILSILLPAGVWRWLVRAVAVFFAARWIIPRGEAWEFIEPRIPVWLAFIVAGTLLAWWLSERLSHGAPGFLALGWIACVIAAAVLSQEFLRVTEPLLAVASVLGISGLMCVRLRQPGLASIAIGPSLFAMAVAVSSAKFNSFAGLPDSLSWLAIMAPAIAGLPTLTIRKDQPMTRGKVALVVISCIVMSAVVITWTLVAGGLGGGEEEW